MNTTCTFPPELDEKQLLVYLDDPDSNPETTRHLDKCPHCHERAQALEDFQKSLGARLYRVTCPSPMQLGEYKLGYLSDPQKLVLAQHVRQCPHCSRELAELEGFLGEFEVPLTGLAALRRLVATLVSGPGVEQSAGFPQTPAFGGLRGEGDEPFIYQAENVRIVIEVQDDVEQMGRKTLLGLVTGLESNEFMIQVSQGEQMIATSSVDEIGNFMIPHLSPGHYRLVLSGANMEIHVQSLPV